MNITRLDLDGAALPSALVTRILELEPGLTLPIPIEALCRQFDIIDIRDLETDGFEAALLTDVHKASGAILVAQGGSHHRRRFSIAHELGHFLIPTHLPPVGGGFRCSSEDLRLQTAREQDRHSRMEAQANQFAALLLMPPPLLRAELRAIRTPDVTNIVRLARMFDVSKDAMARAYVEAHRQSVAVLVVHEGKLVRSYRAAGRFPWIDVNIGSKVPLASVAHEHRLLLGETSQSEECEPEVWLTARDARHVEVMTEQVLGQVNGYALILLQVEMRDGDSDQPLG